MAIDKHGWTKDSKNTASTKQEKYVHGGDLNAQHAKYDAEQERKAGLSKKQMSKNGIPAPKDFPKVW
jgi:hypothetical protein